MSISRLLPGALLVLAATACHSTAPGTTAATPAATPAPLRNTHWALRRLNGQPIDYAGGQEPFLLLRSDQARAEGQAGCNRFGGEFEQPTPEQIKVSRLLSTKMACGALAVENGFVAALSQTSYFRISGDTLRLYAGPPADNKPLAELLATTAP